MKAANFLLNLEWINRSLREINEIETSPKECGQCHLHEALTQIPDGPNSETPLMTAFTSPRSESPALVSNDHLENINEALHSLNSAEINISPDLSQQSGFLRCNSEGWIFSKSPQHWCVSTPDLTRWCYWGAGLFRNKRSSPADWRRGRSIPSARRRCICTSTEWICCNAWNKEVIDISGQSTINNQIWHNFIEMSWINYMIYQKTSLAWQVEMMFN